MILNLAKASAISGIVVTGLHLLSHGYIKTENYFASTFARTTDALVGDMAEARGYQRPELDRHTVDDKIELEAAINGLHPDLIRAVIKQESTNNPWAKSSVGARGLMQLMPDTAKACGMKDAAEAYIPSQNIECGTYWLSAQIKAENGDLVRGLQRYNGGPRCVGKCAESLDFSRNVLRYFYSKKL